MLFLTMDTDKLYVYKDFLKDAHERGMKVQALFGDPAMIYDDFSQWTRKVIDDISDYNNDSGMVDEGNATQEENAIQEDNIIQEDNAIQEENNIQVENAIQVENESNDVSSLFEAVFIFIISIITRESKKK